MMGKNIWYNYEGGGHWSDYWPLMGSPATHFSPYSSLVTLCPSTVSTPHLCFLTRKDSLYSSPPKQKHIWHLFMILQSFEYVSWNNIWCNRIFSDLGLPQHSIHIILLHSEQIKETPKRRKREREGARLTFNWRVIVGRVDLQLCAWMDNLWQGRL